MKSRWMMAAAAALVLGACGGDAGDGGDGGADGKSEVQTGASGDTMGAAGTTDGTSTGVNTGQPVDTAGMGTNPPTAGGQVVDSASAATGTASPAPAP